ncbi:MAG: hypothetical protein IJE22_08660 [Oscillibacter sp.]|nr:hypothetical protein [Oscillibacter sp.]
MNNLDAYADLLQCKNVKFIKIWEDPEGVYPAMPLFEMTEEPAEVWNQRAKKAVVE